MDLRQQTLPPTNIASVGGYLEDQFPFQGTHASGSDGSCSCLIQGGTGPEGTSGVPTKENGGHDNWDAQLLAKQRFPTYVLAEIRGLHGWRCAFRLPVLVCGEPGVGGGQNLSPHLVFKLRGHTQNNIRPYKIQLRSSWVLRVIALRVIPRMGMMLSRLKANTGQKATPSGYMRVLLKLQLQSKHAYKYTVRVRWNSSAPCD